MVTSSVGARERVPAVRGIVASLVVPSLTLIAFEHLGRWTNRAVDRGDLLPFDAAATYGDAYLAALLLVIGLTIVRIAGVIRLRWFLFAGSALGMAAPLFTPRLTVPFWTASTAMGAAAATLVWLLVRSPIRRRHGMIRYAGGLLGSVAMLFVALQAWHFLVERPIRNLSVITRSVADGGAVSSYTYWHEAGAYSWGTSAVLYAPPGLWARNEPVFALPYPETLASVRRFEFYQGERLALLVSPRNGDDLIAKRVMLHPLRWKGDPPSREKRPQWRQPHVGIPCLARAFAAPRSKADEILVYTSDPISRMVRTDELLVDVRGPGVSCGFGLRPWSIEAVDPRADRVYATATHAPPGQPRNLVFSSVEPDGDWVLDFEATVKANPEAEPLPVPEGLTATITTVELAGDPEDVPSGDWHDLDRLLALPGASVGCTAEGELRARNETRLACTSSAGGTTGVDLTAVSGDPNPHLVAISVAQAWGRQYLLLPIDLRMPIPPTRRADRLQIVFLTLRSRTP
jgi:hypothetical protein